LDETRASVPSPPHGAPWPTEAAVALPFRPDGARKSVPPVASTAARSADVARKSFPPPRRESVPGGRPSGVPARMQTARVASKPFVRPAEPSVGAARREGVLLAAFAVLFVVGVWTVVVAELSPQEPDNLHPQTVTLPTQKPQAAGN
jgi:hypothetical protein